MLPLTNASPPRSPARSRRDAHANRQSPARRLIRPSADEHLAFPNVPILADSGQAAKDFTGLCVRPADPRYSPRRDPAMNCALEARPVLDLVPGGEH
jgi:hypothetical protein